MDLHVAFTPSARIDHRLDLGTECLRSKHEAWEVELGLRLGHEDLIAEGGYVEPVDHVANFQR